MARLTRPKDEWECRLAGACPVEDWIMENLGVSLDMLKENVCDNCPFIKHINKLAAYEDVAESLIEEFK